MDKLKVDQSWNSIIQFFLFSECGKAKIARQGLSESTAKWLWERSEELTGCSFKLDWAIDSSENKFVPIGQEIPRNFNSLTTILNEDLFLIHRMWKRFEFVFNSFPAFFSTLQSRFCRLLHVNEFLLFGFHLRRCYRFSDRNSNCFGILPLHVRWERKGFE